MKDFLVGRISWWKGNPSVKDFLEGRKSQCEGFPDGKDFLVGRKSQTCERFPGVKDYLAGRISWWERIPGGHGKDFRSRLEKFPDDKISQ